jgi:ActR/RegA family two-component response regulator
MYTKNCQNKRTAQRLVPSGRRRLAKDTALKRDPRVRKLRKVVNSNREDWKALAREAANEQDPKKLLAIVEELNKALEERENQLRGVSRRIATKREGGNELLFVDDEPSIRLTLPPILQQRGFHVQVASNVSEALAVIKTHRFDVLLSDINIEQEGDGFTVVEAMRKANPDAVTILLTGYPAFESAVRSIRVEVDDYFTKPADLDAIVSTIDRKLLTRGIQRTVPTKKASQTSA